MTSTYTSNKTIEKPANGDYPDTWNVPVNADWDIIDKALGSSVSKTLSNIDVFLTLSEAQNQQIILTGALTGNVNVVIPFKNGSASEAVGGTWVVYNNTTGAYNVGIVTEVAGSTGVFITQGKRAFVYSDGTNMNFADDVRLTAGNAGVTVSGGTISLAIPVTVANGGTGQTSYTTGDVLYASGSTSLAKLGIGTSGQVLTVSAGGLPTWAAASGGGGGTGTVTSVGFSTGTTGLSVSSSTTNPFTTSGTFTLAGTLGVPNGGTGANSLTGYVKGSGSGALTAVATISGSDVSGNITGNAANVTGTVAISNGGTGATSSSTAASNLGLGTSSAVSFGSVTTSGAGTFNTVKVGASSYDNITYASGVISIAYSSSSYIFGTGSGIEHYAAGIPNFATSSTYFRLQGGITPQAYGTTTWTNISDSRTKKDELPYVKGLSDLKTLNVVSYKYNGLYGTPNNDVRYCGLIAQEVLNTNFSDMVGTYIYTDPQTKQQTQLYDVNTSQLVFALINAVKELSNRVAALEAKLP